MASFVSSRRSRPVTVNVAIRAIGPSTIRIGNVAASPANTMAAAVAFAPRYPRAAYADSIVSSSGAGFFHASPSRLAAPARSSNSFSLSTVLPENARWRSVVTGPGSTCTDAVN